MKPQISLICPVYNVENYLCRCIESILAQNVSDWELLLVDDGSTDRSGLICDEYASIDPRIKVLHKTNGGVSVARNVGLDIAKGNYIAFIDPDDVLVTDSLCEILHAMIAMNADVGFAKTFRFCNSDFSDRNEIYSFSSSMVNIMHNGQDLYINNISIRSVVWGGVYRTSFIKAHDLRFIEGIANGEDSLFMAYCYIANPRVIFIDQDYYLFYQRDGSATHSWTESRINGYIMNLSYLINRLDVFREKDMRFYMINLQIYSVVSNLFHNMNYCYSRLLRREMVQQVSSLLERLRIDFGPIKRSRVKLYILNYSVSLFANLSRLAFRVRQIARVV